MKLLFALSLLLLTCACASPGSNPEDELIQAPPPPDSLVSPSIIVIADNQQAMEYRQGNFETTSGLKRALNHRSVTRPRTLTLWSLDIVEEIAANEEESSVILHLGDVLNNSCLTEWEQVRNKFDTVRRNSWYVAPGNHDGYYFGLTHPMPGENGNAGSGPLNEYTGWAAACIPLNSRVADDSPEILTVTDNMRREHVINKARFIQLYLNELTSRGINLPDQTDPDIIFSDQADPSINLSDQICGTVDHTTLRGVCFDINSEEPWHSFIVQYLVVGEAGKNPVHIVITDTSAFDYQPKLLSWWRSKKMDAYEPVNLTDPVISATSYWLKRNNPDNTVVLAGHHPFKKFETGREDILELWAAGLFDAYVSGDTHDGLVMRHEADGSAQGLLEVNIGSVLDPPVEYRTLRAYQAPGGDRGIQMKRTFLTPPPDSDSGGYKPLPASSTVFEECPSLDNLTSPDVSRWEASIQALLGLIKGKGFETRRDILLEEASLYRRLAQISDVSPGWDAMSNPVAVSGNECAFVNAETLEVALDTLTSEAFKNSCWPQDQGPQTIVLARMSKVLVEAGAALDVSIASSANRAEMFEYRVCAALISTAEG